MQPRFDRISVRVFHVSLLCLALAACSGSSTTLSVTAPTTTFNVERGNQVAVPVAVVWPQNINSTFAVTGNNLPSGVAVSASATPLSPLGAVTFAVASTASTGTVTAALTGAFGSEKATFSVSINVTSPTLQLILSPASATLAASGVTSAALTLVTSDGTTPVTLALQNAATGISATFPALSLAAPNGNVTFTTSALAPGTYNFNVIATQGAATATAPFTITVPAPQTVTLTVTEIDGYPLEAVSVKIGSQTTTTDDTGVATFANVTVPYDVRIVWVDTATAFGGYVIHGVTNSHPQLCVLQQRELASFHPVINTSISGTVAGTPVPAASDVLGLVLFNETDADNVFSLQSIAPFGSGVFSGLGFSATPGPFSGVLWALTWAVDGSGAPTRLSSTASTPLANLTAGDNTDNPLGQINTTALPANNQFSGTITPPSGYFVASQNYALQLTPVEQLVLDARSVTKETTGFDQFSFPMVAIVNPFAESSHPGNISFRFQVAASDAAGDVLHWTELPTLAGGDEEVDMTLPTALSDFSPANNATGFAPSTPISWTAGSAGLTMLELFIQGNGSTTRTIDLTCVSDGASCGDLDFSDMANDFALPQQQSLSIYATQIFGEGVDQITEPNALNGVFVGLPSGRTLWANPATVTVTTAQ